MDHYNVNFTPQALADLDQIYTYISYALLEPQTASRLLNRIENAVLSLEQMPYRCPERSRGIYAYQGYRQLLVEGYTVIFRVDENEKKVLIVTVRYSRSKF